MLKKILILCVVIYLTGCNTGSQTVVSNFGELEQAIETAQPGDAIVMKNGIWKDMEIKFTGKGAENKPITLKAETSGQVFIEGLSYLKLGGEYLVVKGLYFRNGRTPVRTVIDFKIDNKNIANHSRVTNCVVEEFNQMNRYDHDHWVEFWGRHNQLDNCYIAGKSNQGPTIRVYLGGNEHIRNYHKITNNHFGPRPRKGGPKAETMQIGDSYTSMTPSYIQVTDNFFEKCNGEVEIISSKSNFNEFRNNIFLESEGSLVMRHGNYCIVDGNVFIGSEASKFVGGIRVINTGHWITNNYFYKLKADEFRSPLAVMNGIPKSPLNRYNQVTDAVIAHNTWIDCKSPWQFSVGCNNGKIDVLPKSEIRSARPIRTVVANNLIFNHEKDTLPIKSYDEVDGVQFENNIIHGGKVEYDGIKERKLTMKKLSDWLYIPTGDSNLEDVYAGFGFEDIKTDIFGNSRNTKNLVGAISGENNIFEIDRAKYGPQWFTPNKTIAKAKVIRATGKNLAEAVRNASSGDIIEVEKGIWGIDESISISKKITIKSKDGSAKIIHSGKGALFQMLPKANLKLENLVISGNGKQLAFETLEKNMSFPYNLYVKDCQLSSFRQLLKAHKGSMADTLCFSGTKFNNCESGIELAAETNDKGDYNAEFVYIKNCEFSKIQKDVLNYYRGGYDESTIGGNLEVSENKFENCGKLEESKILLKTRGIINVEINNNMFKSNPVKLVAVLWGEKNNHHSENIIKNSGKIRVDQYLKQKLVY